jgi:hypothetical protein
MSENGFHHPLDSVPMAQRQPGVEEQIARRQTGFRITVSEYEEAKGDMKFWRAVAIIFILISVFVGDCALGDHAHQQHLRWEQNTTNPFIH